MESTNKPDDLIKETTENDSGPYYTQANQLKRLAKVVESGLGFSPVFSMFYDASYRDLMISKVQNIYAGSSVVLEANFVEYPDMNTFVKAMIEYSKKYKLIQVTNLENWLFPRFLGGLISELNMYKPYLTEHCKTTVVWWLAEKDLINLETNAQDIWSIKAGLLGFELDHTSVIDENPQPTNKETQLIENKHKRINEIETILAAAPTDVESIVRSYLLFELGELYYYIDKVPQATNSFEKSLAFAEINSYKVFKSSVCHNIGIIYKELKEYELSKEFFYKTLTISEELGDKSGIISALHYLSRLHQEEEEYDIAKELVQRSLHIHEELGKKLGIASCAHRLGILHQILDEYELAKAFLYKSLALYKELDNKVGIASSFNYLGRVYHAEDKHDIAKEFFYESLVLYEELDSKDDIALVSCQLGNIYVSENDYFNTIKHYSRSLQIFKYFKYPYLKMINEMMELIKVIIGEEKFNEYQKEAEKTFSNNDGKIS
ncbi:MAG: tetratricopeptide repeat protein [Candidatus Magnetoovum sp. WYHC-5]|nr:tetratricopeptide repeat protein [Candidatus Magnetoovum sp. WYHC-5]